MRVQEMRALLASSSIAAAASIGALGQPLPNTAIAVSGLPAPGRPPGVVFSDIGSYYAIREGTIAFQASTTENGPRASGAWVLQGNVLSQPIYGGQPIVNLSNQTVSNAANIELDSSGDIAFENVGILEFKHGSVYQIATANMPIPGADSGVVGAYGQPSLNESGNIAFRADSGLYTDAFGAGLQLVAPAGQAAPGGGTYRTFDRVVVSGDRITTRAQSYIFGISCTAIYSFTPNSADFIAATNSPAPLLPNYVLDSFERIYINVAGHVTFPAYLYDPSHLSDQFRILYSENSAGLRTLMKSGQPAPGLPGFMLNDIYNSVSSNNDRVLALTVLNDGRRALFASGASDAMHLVTLTGQPAPDMPNGITFGQDFSYYGIGDTGTVGFMVDLNDPTGVLSSHRAFFAANPQGVIRILVDFRAQFGARSVARAASGWQNGSSYMEVPDEGRLEKPHRCRDAGDIGIG